MNKLNYLISILPKEIKFKALILLGLIIVCMFLEVMTIGLVLPLTASIVSGNNISEGIF